MTDPATYTSRANLRWSIRLRDSIGKLMPNNPRGWRKFWSNLGISFYLLVGIVTFGHAARHAGNTTTFHDYAHGGVIVDGPDHVADVAQGVAAGFVWPLYWSYVLQPVK